MARVKLPEALKAWKIISRLPDKNDNEVYLVRKSNSDGTKTKARLTYVAISGEEYNPDTVSFVRDEAEFIKTIRSLDGVSNYIDVDFQDKPDKEKAELFIITEDTRALSDTIDRADFDEAKVTDFGLKISGILEKLEQNNIYHGNLTPRNIYVSKDGSYKLGGFTDLESKITGYSFLAPEINRDEPADFTTDIYSLGIIMYYMCNNKKLPFEKNGLTKIEAIDKRFSGESIPAPMYGSEKLRSVIIIACQPENKNRWKNAGNIKNALLSIKSELEAENEAQAETHEEIIVPAQTDFNKNVFEVPANDQGESAPEDAVDQNEQTADGKSQNDTKQNEAVTEEATRPAQEQAADAEAETTENTEDETLDESSEKTEAIDDSILHDAALGDDNNPIFYKAESVIPIIGMDTKVADVDNSALSYAPSASFESAAPEQSSDSEARADAAVENTELDNRVFDNYELEKKVFSINEQPNAEPEHDPHDYGSFFDDEPEKTTENQEQTKIIPDVTDNNISNNSDDSFESNILYKQQIKKEEENNSKAPVIIAVATAAAIALLAVLCVVGYNVGIFNRPNVSDIIETPETSTTNTTSAFTTSPSTTAPSTTVGVTTVPSTTVPTTTAPRQTEASSTEQKKTESTKVYAERMRGEQFDYAKEYLEGLGFEVIEGDYYYDNVIYAGNVLSQTPAGNDYLEKGSRIVLDISLGPKPTQKPTSGGNSSSGGSSSSGGGSSSGGNSSSGGSSSSGNDYSKCDLNTTYLSAAEVESMSNSELNISLNEIYARRGRIFKDPNLSAYFNSQSWYTPKYTAEQFDSSVFNSYEENNLNLIYREQVKRGLR